MIDSAQLVDLDMNISFVRLLWKYDCVAVLVREMAFIACRNGIHRLQNNGVNTGHWRGILILCDKYPSSLLPRAWVVCSVGDGNTTVELISIG
jgi:hypothetical protein